VTVLSVAYPLLPVSSASAGGAEQILHILERGVIQAGHHSLVIAAAGSEVSGELLPTPPLTAEIIEQDQAAAQKCHLSSIELALRRHSIDIIHFHGLDFHCYLPITDVPKLATLHLPPFLYPDSIFNIRDLQLNCVSQTQAASTPGTNTPPVIANGIDTDCFLACPDKEDYLLWIGRICPEKGVHIALQVAHDLDLELRMAGPVHRFRSHLDYFSEQVAPLLDSKRIHVGPADLKRKAELLSKARCLLIPSLIAETSSLVAMEALASGTPVVACRSGALPEVVEDGLTGFVVNGREEMAAAVRRCTEISPLVCRETAVRRFSSKRMIAEYLNLYDRIRASA
jgi:glycosyltransferase involved in cell wall biosynthesis